MNEPADTPAKDPARPHRVAARRATWHLYLRAWLFATFCFVALGVMWALNEGAKRDGTTPGGAFLVAPLVALLTAPTLWLLRLFPERSPSTWLRFLRRLLIGAVCGSFPSSILAALTAASADPHAMESAGVVWISGFFVGVVAGITDAMHLDARAANVRDDAEATAS